MAPSQSTRVKFKKGKESQTFILFKNEMSKLRQKMTNKDIPCVRTLQSITGV